MSRLVRVVTKLQFYNDRQELSELEPSLSGELRLRSLVSKGKSPRVSFCGLLIKDNTPVIFLPRSVDLSSMDEIGKILVASKLMQAVEMYGQRSKTAVDSSDDGSSFIGESLLRLVMSLLKTYRDRGLYARRRSTKTVNAGKPDWKATVSSSVAFPNKTGHPVYLDIVTTKRRYYSDCEVARIQALVLREIDKKYSWIVTGKLGSLAPELDDIPLPRGELTYMLSILRRELPFLYSDNDVNLVKSLINYLQEISGKENTNTIVGLRKFHFAWEFMLSKVLADVWPGINKILPAPAYRMPDGSIVNAFRSGMQTDTALRRKGERKIVIVDAKYYEATTVINAPGWGDIVKQFFYEKALAAVGDPVDITNVFVFPGKTGVFTQVHLRSKRDSNQFYDDEFPPIHCYYVDPLVLINHFINMELMHDFTETLFGTKRLLELVD